MNKMSAKYRFWNWLDTHKILPEFVPFKVHLMVYRFTLNKSENAYYKWEQKNARDS